MSKNPQLPVGDGEEIPEDLVDPSQVVDDQDELMYAWKHMGSGDDGKDDPVRLVGEWVPGDSEYHGKTDVSLNQTRPIALLLQFENMFPDIVGDGMYKEVIKSIDNYEQLLTSWEGKSREEQVKVLSSLPGSQKDENTGGGGSMIPWRGNDE